MASHGRKTEEQGHVFSNQNYINTIFVKVWSSRTLYLCFFCAVVLLALPVDGAAQSGDVSSRLNRLENEIDTLNRAVYRGEKPPTPLYNEAPQPAGGARDAAQTEIRLQQMETQLRDLTGRLEKQTFEINKLRQQVEILSLPVAKPQSAEVERDNALPRVGQPAQPVTPQIVESQNKPLDLGFVPPEPTGMKQAIPGGNDSGVLQVNAGYEAAFANLKAKKYEEAEKGFESFLTAHPDHVLAANAKYWLGETYYVQGEYKQAAKSFAEGFQKYPDSAKAPDILLKLGKSLARMEKVSDACVALGQVSKKFPVGHDNVVVLANQEREQLGCE